MATLSQIEYLVAVEQHRHFGKAAKACHVSQPTLSMQLQKLEEEYGIIFFDRAKQPIVPTEEAKELIEQAKTVLREFGKFNYLSKNRAEEPSGEFRLALIPTIAPYLLPLFVGAFAKHYPKVKLFVEELTTDGIIRALEEDKVDAGILATPLGIDRFIEKPLYYEPFHLFVSKTHKLYNTEAVREQDLDGREIWLLSEGHCLRSQIIRLCSVRGKPGIFPNVRFESGNIETLIHLVVQGHGYTLLPHLATRTLIDPERKRMVRSFVRPVPSREVSLVCRRTQYKDAILKALTLEILEHLPKELPREKSKSIEVLRIS